MLIDTNIIVEIAKRQQCYRECADLLDAINQGQVSEEVYITRFALSVVEAIIGKVNRKFLQEILLMIYRGSIRVFNLEIQDDMMALGVLDDRELDFDDAIQFIAANKLRTYIVTLDKDFRKTGIKVKTPKEVIFTIAKRLK